MEEEALLFNGYDMSRFPIDGEKWKYGVTRRVLFFGKLPLFEVTFVDIANAERYLSSFTKESRISLDFEWNSSAEDPVINTYQFCQGQRVLVVHDRGEGPTEQVGMFLSWASGNKFFGKGCHFDFQMLRKRFGSGFRIELEDIAKTRLRPYGYSENFEAMIEQFAGETTVRFKDKNVALSRWDLDLSIAQVLYAAFDVAALCACYPNFPAPKIVEKARQSKRFTRPAFRTEEVVEKDPIRSIGDAITNKSLWLLREQRNVMIPEEDEPVTVTVLSADDPLLRPLLRSIVGGPVVLNIFHENEAIPMLISIRYSHSAIVVQRYDGYEDHISDLWTGKSSLTIFTHGASVKPLRDIYHREFPVVGPGNIRKVLPKFGPMIKGLSDNRMSIGLVVSMVTYTSMCKHTATKQKTDLLMHPQ